MAYVILSDDETKLLAKETPEVLKAYISIKRHGDRNTGIAGIMRRFNYAYFIKILSAQPKHSKKKPHVTLSHVKRILQRLVKIKLVQKIGALTFRLPFFCAQKNLDPNRASKNSDKSMKYKEVTKQPRPQHATTSKYPPYTYKENHTSLPQYPTGAQARVGVIINNGEETAAHAQRLAIPEMSAAFLEFWSLYPAERQIKKGAAWHTWQHFECEEVAEQIMADLPERVRTTELKYLPLPANYLRDKRWEDWDSVPTMRQRQRVQMARESEERAAEEKQQCALWEESKQERDIAQSSAMSQIMSFLPGFKSKCRA